MFLRLVIIIIILFTTSNVRADVYFTLPEEIEIENVNKNIKTTTKSRYNKAEQIENQYKGKLKYKPSNNMIRNDRKGRFYTSVSFLKHYGYFSKVEVKGNNTEFEANKDNEFKDTFSAEVGVYIRDNILMNIEYFELVNKTTTFNSIKTKLNGKAYFFNIAAENNYSKIIPFLGIGVGVLKNDFEEDFSNNTYSNNNEVDGNISTAYQFFAGLDIAYNENFLFTVKYRYLNTLSDIKLTRTYNNITNDYLLKFKNGDSAISVGFKYLW